MDQQKPTELEALKELGNIGVGNASTALSKMLNKKIDITIPDAKFVALEKFSEIIGGPETIVHGIFLKLEGDLAGQSLFLFQDKSALELADLLLGLPDSSTKKLENESLSAFQEMANIFVGSFLNSIGEMLQLKLLPGIPHYGNDMAQAIIDIILAEIGKKSDKVLFINTKFSVESKNVSGSFIMFFDPESLKKLVESIEKAYGIEIAKQD